MRHVLTCMLLIFFAALESFAGSEASGSMIYPVFQDKTEPVQRHSITQEQVLLERAIDSTYIVGPGDFFELLSPKGLDVVQVSPEGTISVPDCGMVNVDRMTLKDAKIAIQQLMTLKYDERYVRVQIVRMRKMPITVLGAVVLPGRRSLDPQTRLSTALSIFGGLSTRADRSKMLLYRGTDTLLVDYAQFEDNGVEAWNIMLESGDVLYVPYISSEGSITIKSPLSTMSIPCYSNKTLGELFDTFGSLKELNVKWINVKTPDGKVSTYDLATARDLRAVPQSEIELWEKEPFVYVGGAVATMGKAPYNPQYHAIDYIAASGVTIITGSWSRVTMIRDGKSKWIDPYHDEILPGDYLEIPRTVYESVKDVVLFLASLLTVISTAIIIAHY